LTGRRETGLGFTLLTKKEKGQKKCCLRPMISPPILAGFEHKYDTVEAVEIVEV
jgi:hypothetical protein